MQHVFITKRPEGNTPWLEFGCDKRTYEFWAPHVCAMACARSLILMRGSRAPTLWQMTSEAIKYGVYRIEKNGLVTGAFHYPLSGFLSSYGICADVFARRTLDRIAQYVSAGRCVVLSIALPETDSAQAMSHLILVFAFDEVAREFVCHDNANILRPNGESIRLPWEELEKLSNGRGLVCGMC